MQDEGVAAARHRHWFQTPRWHDAYNLTESSANRRIVHTSEFVRASLSVLALLTTLLPKNAPAATTAVYRNAYMCDPTELRTGAD